MPDQYEAVRNLPFEVVAPALNVDLKRFKHHKNEWVGYCPIHKSKNNNNCFRYHAVDGRWHCFSCGAKGKGAVDLAMRVNDSTFTAALVILTPLTAQLRENFLYHSDVARNVVGLSSELKPYSGKYERFKVPCPWLDARIPDKAIQERFGVFCYDNKARKSAYSGRLMIPIRDVDGQLYGYCGRDISHNPEVKYLFPSGFSKSRFLFGAFELCTFGQLPLRRVYLVESPLCVMKFAMYGLPAVSPFGFSFSAEQIQVLAGLTRGAVYLRTGINMRTEDSNLPLYVHHCGFAVPNSHRILMTRNILIRTRYWV